jgi:mRNA interferase MazF
MEIKRGAVVICVFPKLQGKPRPGVVVQSDLFNATHATVTLCPITGTVRDYPLFRIDVPPSRSNGLKKHSQVMVDKIITIPREHIGQVVGEVSTEQIRAINSSLQLWLALE